jgi:hypothetical protein
MIAPDDMVPLSLSAADLNIVLAALAELPFKASAPVIERVRAQVLAYDPAAFLPATPAPSRVNGVDVERE